MALAASDKSHFEFLPPLMTTSDQACPKHTSDSKYAVDLEWYRWPPVCLASLRVAIFVVSVTRFSTYYLTSFTKRSQKCNVSLLQYLPSLRIICRGGNSVQLKCTYVTSESWMTNSTMVFFRLPDETSPRHWA